MTHDRLGSEGGTDLYGFARNAETAGDLLRGGVRVLQFRDKERDDRDFRAEAERILAAVRRFPDAVLIVNDRVDGAVEIGADGVRAGPEDATAAGVRRRVPEDFIVGVSARTVERAKEAERAGADYLGVGAVFPTATQADAEHIGLAGLRKVMAAVSRPVVAIGVSAPVGRVLKGRAGGGASSPAKNSRLISAPSAKAKAGLLPWKTTSEMISLADRKKSRNPSHFPRSGGAGIFADESREVRAAPGNPEESRPEAARDSTPAASGPRNRFFLPGGVFYSGIFGHLVVLP